jgi:hypothetical protein
MQMRLPLRRAMIGRPRGRLGVLLLAAVALQLGCPIPTESSNLNPSTFGQTVTFTGTATSTGPTPTGTMDFKDGATTLAGGVPLDGTGKAVFATASLAIGSHSMTVHYSGDSNYSPGDSSPLTQVVQAAVVAYFTVSPCRLVDTRGPNGPLGGPSLAAGQNRTFTLAGACNIPSNASAVSVNITIVSPSTQGFLTLYPGGSGLPAVSNLNFSAGQVRANNAIVTLGALGDATVFLGQASGNAHVIIDVNGYLQ